MNAHQNQLKDESWKIQTAEHDFEKLIEGAKKNSRGLDRLRACVFWEFARESETIRHEPKLEKALAGSSLTRDEKYRLGQFRTGQLADFPERPWLDLPTAAQDSFIKTLLSPEVLFYPSIGAGAAALQTVVERNRKRAEKTGSGMVIVLTEASWRRHGREELGKIVAEAISRPQDVKGELVKTASPWHGLKHDHFASALRILGYCRVRTDFGQAKANEYERKLNTSERRKLKVRDWEQARERTNHYFHRFFPWLPDSELPLHGRSVADLEG